MHTCTFCGNIVQKQAARGLCAACYYREKRNGTPDYVKVRKPCTISGCNELSVAKGYCETHYRRFMKSGDPVAERYERWGHAGSHPLYQTHRRLFRDRIKIVDEWIDFWKFVSDVGDRPTARHQFRRIDYSLPVGPKNFVWHEPVMAAPARTKPEKALRMRIYRAEKPDVFKRLHLKKIGLSEPEYTSMLDGQGGVCAICGKPETMAIRGKTVSLAVDHDHKTGKIRGLLCTPCNRGIGLLKDDPNILNKAISYLALHNDSMAS